MTKAISSPALYAHQNSCHFDRSADRGAEKPASLPITRPSPQAVAFAFAVAFLACHPGRGPAFAFAFAFAVASTFSQPSVQNIVISTEGGAFAAAVERPPHFAFAFARQESLYFAFAVASIAFAVVVAVASRYPKASALGLYAPQQKRGFSPWRKHSYRNITLTLITAAILTTTACRPRKPVPDPKPIPKPIPKTITSR